MNKKIPPDRLIVAAQTSGIVADCLSYPQNIAWPASWPEINQLCDNVKKRMEPPLQPLMDLSLAAHLLLTFPSLPDLQQARQEFQRTLDPNLLPSDIWNHDGNWRLMPVVTVASEIKEASIYNFMVGTPATTLAAHWPEWLTGYLDISSQVAIHEAFQAAQIYSGISRHLFMFPLISPKTIQKIEGRSLGLPLALGALSALTGETMASCFLATGNVQNNAPKFSIEAVAGISIKNRKAVEEKLQLMLIPQNGLSSPEQLPGLKIKGVRDLKEAWLWARLYAPEHESELERLQHMQRDHRFLVDNCLNIDHPELLEWLMDSEHGEPMRNAVAADMNCVQTLVKKLDNCLAPANRDLKHADILSSLISEDHFICMKKCFKIDAFKWAVLNLKLANHSGKNDSSHYWAQQAESFRDVALDITPEEFTEFINNLCVFRHNAYTFRPEPAPDFLKAMADEQRYNRGINIVLGRLCGTLAQNYAFCGPRYLNDVIENIHLAQRQFCDGDMLEYRNDWLREFSYLVYAFLDAGDRDRARQALLNYLEITSLPDLKPWRELNDPYKQAALMRYLADTADCGDSPEKQLAFRLVWEHRNFTFKAEHPCQLIAWNLGRLALNFKHSDLAKHYFESSITLCEQSAETIKVMALLPLSGLYGAGLWNPQQEASATAVLENIRTSRFLNPDHFAALMEGDIFHALNLVRKEPARFFPFSYR